MDTVAAIEAVLSYGNKSSTYKLAVLRALVDITIEAPGREPRNGFHSIPVVDIARRIMAYYWRPSLLGIPQLTKNSNAVLNSRGYSTSSIPGIVCSLSDSDAVVPGIELKDEIAGGLLADWILEAESLPKEVERAILDVRGKLIEQPLVYLPNLRGKKVDFFSIFTHATRHEEQLSPFADHTEHLKRSPKLREMSASTWNGLLDNERTFVVLSARSYEEISEYRYWLKDAIILRWARECGRWGGFATDKISLSAFDLVHGAERDPVRVNLLKSLYRSAGVDRCLYSGKKLDPKFDLDHFLPFSRFPVNLFWNMVPSSKLANRGKDGKFDLIPVLTDDLKASYKRFLSSVLATDDQIVLRDMDATYRRYYQDLPPRELSIEGQVNEVFSVVTKSWKRLESAGIGVWELNA